MQVHRAVQTRPRVAPVLLVTLAPALFLLLGGCSGLGLLVASSDEAAPGDSEVSDDEETPSQDETPSDSDPVDEVVDDPEEPDDDDDDDDDDDTTDPEEPPVSPIDLCFADIAAPPGEAAPNYDQFNPTVASHCNGTDHQDISGVERVVFLGDSVTVGTPPTPDAEFYRSLLANQLVAEFGLEAPGPLWEAVNFFEGTSFIQDGGDFASCAEWGARADDLVQDGDQILSCFPESERDKTTLVVMTVGGNDLSNLTSGFIEGLPLGDLWSQTEEAMQLVREAVEWLKAPGRFPNGVYVVTTNLYEFTDATGDVTSCPAAGLAGFDAAVEDPALAEMVIWAMEEFMSIAVDTATDMLFLLETFCGHGYNFDDPNGRCYRGAQAELWFDLTCVHPNPIGHSVIADMFLSVVQE